MLRAFDSPELLLLSGGLRIGDESVLPRQVRGHTRAAALMIGERAADFILHAAATPLPSRLIPCEHSARHRMIMRFRERLRSAILKQMSAQAGRRFRTVAVEDDARYRASLGMLLRHSPDFDLVGSFASPAAALRGIEVANGRPDWDLVLMDIDLPEISGIECTRRIKVSIPDIPIVVLTVFEDRASIIEAICAGADGYLLKRTGADELLVQLRAILAGGSPLSAGVARTVLDVVRHVNQHKARPDHTGARAVDLTDREREVLACLVEGMSYKAVANALDISIDTVRSHIRTVYRKLQVHSVAEAVSRALQNGLL